VTPTEVEAAVKRLCDELHIENMCTAEAQELHAGGCHGGGQGSDSILHDFPFCAIYILRAYPSYA
jgi:hypothetical protein